MGALPWGKYGEKGATKGREGRPDMRAENQPLDVSSPGYMAQGTCQALGCTLRLEVLTRCCVDPAPAQLEA